MNLLNTTNLSDLTVSRICSNADYTVLVCKHIDGGMYDVVLGIRDCGYSKYTGVSDYHKCELSTHDVLELFKGYILAVRYA